MKKVFQRSFTLFYVLGLVAVNICYFSLKSDKHPEGVSSVSEIESMKHDIEKQEILSKQVSLK